MPEKQYPVLRVAPAPLHWLPRELVSEVVNWIEFAPEFRWLRASAADGATSPKSDTDLASGEEFIELRPRPQPVSGVYESYVCSRLQRMPTVWVYN